MDQVSPCEPLSIRTLAFIQSGMGSHWKVFFFFSVSFLIPHINDIIQFLFNKS